ncbi:MAG: hypothetical protein M1826_002244, partial [Phylliscum demangeonii]
MRFPVIAVFVSSLAVFTVALPASRSLQRRQGAIRLPEGGLPEALPPGGGNPLGPLGQWGGKAFHVGFMIMIGMQAAQFLGDNVFNPIYDYNQLQIDNAWEEISPGGRIKYLSWKASRANAKALKESEALAAQTSLTKKEKAKGEAMATEKITVLGMQREIARRKCAAGILEVGAVNLNPALRNYLAHDNVDEPCGKDTPTRDLWG